MPVSRIAAAPALPAAPPRVGLRPAPRSRSDGLSPGQLRAVVVGIVALHAAAGWGLLQIAAVREALTEAAPIFVSLLDAPTPPKPPEPPPPPPPPKVVQRTPPPPVPIITAAPSPAPAVFVAPPPPPVIEPLAPIAPPLPPAPPAPVAAPAPPVAPAPPPAPRNIPPSAIQYLDVPAPVYPRASIRLNESGVVVVRVFIDEAGLPRQVQVAKSSGYTRLDEAAVAGVQKARFKPPTENGQPISGWARIDIPFELEK